MQRLYSKNATGIAPDGRWYAGDINQLQDAVAAISDFLQYIDVGGIRIGESSLQLMRYGAGEARITGAVRTDAILRALGGLYAGAFTTAARDAIPAGSRPYGLIILNTTANQLQVNLGTDATPAWKPIGVDPSGSLIFTNQTVNNYIVSSSRPGDSTPRFQIREDGQMEWSLGSGPADVIISHPSSGILNINPGRLNINGNPVPVSLSGVFASRPPANSLPPGSFYNATDTNQFYQTSPDGSTWNIVNAYRVYTLLAPDPFDIGSASAETDLINYTVPGGLMGQRGELRYRCFGQWAHPSTGSGLWLTIKVYFGGLITWTLPSGATNVAPGSSGSSTGNAVGYFDLTIRNINSGRHSALFENNLPAWGGIAAPSYLSTRNLDTSVAQVLRVTAQTQTNCTVSLGGHRLDFRPYL